MVGGSSTSRRSARPRCAGSTGPSWRPPRAVTSRPGPCIASVTTTASSPTRATSGRPRGRTQSGRVRVGTGAHQGPVGVGVWTIRVRDRSPGHGVGHPSRVDTISAIYSIVTSLGLRNIWSGPLLSATPGRRCVSVWRPRPVVGQGGALPGRPLDPETLDIQGHSFREVRWTNLQPPQTRRSGPGLTTPGGARGAPSHPGRRETTGGTTPGVPGEPVVGGSTRTDVGHDSPRGPCRGRRGSQRPFQHDRWGGVGTPSSVSGTGPTPRSGVGRGPGFGSDPRGVNG